MSARDPWAVLRALRALPLVAATEDDEEINGGDAPQGAGEAVSLTGRRGVAQEMGDAAVVPGRAAER